MTRVAAARVEVILNWMPLVMIGAAFGLALPLASMMPLLPVVVAGAAVLRLKSMRLGLRTKFVVFLHRHFPDMPKSWREAAPGLFFAGVFVVAAGLYGASEAFQWSWKRLLGLEALWFQLCGAALLSWESLASRERIAVVAEDLEKRKPRPPRTGGERAVHFVFTAFGAGMLLLGVGLVAVAAWVTTAPYGWRAAAIIELKVAAFGLGVAAASYGGGWLLDRLSGRTAKAIIEARTAEEVWGLAGEVERVTRRAIRVIGFVLVVLATFLQLQPAWVE